MPEPRIKRYALMPETREDGIRRFHLARVAHRSRTAMAADRLERMEEIAAMERPDLDGGDGNDPARREGGG
jgi:hypothetical protein